MKLHHYVMYRSKQRYNTKGKTKKTVILVENVNDADIMQILCIKLFAKLFLDNARFNNLRNELKSAFH